MLILLFTAVRQPDVTARLIRSTRRTPSTVVLDLEDSLWDVTDSAGTSTLRAAGRTDLVALAQLDRELFSRQRVGVRVNRVSGPDAAADFEALGRASRFVEFDTVVVTKIESGADVSQNLAQLKGGGVAYRSVVPIVETRRGMDNLDDIIETSRSAGIERLAYGHFDLSLDSGWWPFPEPWESSFWTLAEPLIRRWESAGLEYVHPPYFQTHDEEGLALIIRRLERTCEREFGIITVGPRQAAMAARLGGSAARYDEVEASSWATHRATGETPSEIAQRVTSTFLAARREPGGFALDHLTGTFISPHVYVAARNYLRQIGYV